MMDWIINLDAGILLFIQETIRNPVLTPLFAAVTVLGNAAVAYRGCIGACFTLRMCCSASSAGSGAAALPVRWCPRRRGGKGMPRHRKRDGRKRTVIDRNLLLGV